jgi:hypothetical protein
LKTLTQMKKARATTAGATPLANAAWKAKMLAMSNK